MHDIQYAWRAIARTPMFAAVVIGTLTLGIGASTSMFSVVNGVLLAPLPYGNASALVWMFGAFRASDSAAVSPPDFADYRSRNDVFERLGAMAIAPVGVTVTGSGTPTRLQAAHVSAELMTTLGVAPIRGRDLARSDERTASTAILVSHQIWQDRFGGSDEAIGQPIVVDGRVCTVVGVMPPGFTLPYDSFIRLTDPIDLYVPLALDGPDAQIRRFHSLRLIGRLKPAESLQHAQSQMDVVARQLAAVYPDNDTWHLRLVPLHERVVGSVRPVLAVLMAAVLLLLLVSCANVASLLLARAGSRRTEFAVRGALGASPARIVRQLLVEGLALSIAGAAAGLIVTWWTIRILKRVGPAQFPRLDAVAVEPRVIGFALAAAVVTTAIFALVPAIHASRGSLSAGIAPERAATGDRSRRRGQRVLVVAQLAVSLVLLSGAAIVVRGFMRLVSIESGFRSAGVMLTRLPLPEQRYDSDAKIDGFYAQLLARLNATPQIEAAALGTAPPMAGANDSVVYRPGRPPLDARDRRFAQIRWIQGDYFATLGIPLVAGRLFDDRGDRSGAPLVAIVSRRMAHEFFGDDAAIGQRIVVDVGEHVIAQVIGVTGDVRVFGQASDAPPLVYLHARQRPAPYLQLIVRSAAAPADVAAAIRRHVLALDPALAIARIDTMDALVADSVAQPRFSMLLIGSFAALASTLTLIGLYATVAYLVAQRRREIGIRLAIGATRGDIGRMVLRQGATLVAAGIAMGAVGSLLTSRLASALLVNVGSADPILVGMAAALLTVASLTAVLVPTRRAAAVEPSTALRAQE
jgi:putative ABC transport system permease protein